MASACLKEIRTRDERDLQWFFGPGEASFQRSTFGSLLERAQLFAFDSDTCDRCNGSTFVEDDLTCPKCRGCGVIPRKRKRARLLKAACVKCCGTGLNRHGDTCGTCHGYEGLTAKPQPTPREEPSYTPDDETLHRYADVSRRLERLPDAATRVLAAYFGDTGSKWGRTLRGRICALYPLTRSGRELLERSIACGTDGAEQGDDEAIIAVADALKKQRGRGLEASQRELDRLVDGADDEARALLGEAFTAWNALEAA